MLPMQPRQGIGFQSVAPGSCQPLLRSNRKTAKGRYAITRITRFDRCRSILSVGTEWGRTEWGQDRMGSEPYILQLPVRTSVQEIGAEIRVGAVQNLLGIGDVLKGSRL